MQRQQACVIFRHINVQSIESSSGIFIGTNQAAGWRSIGKSNQGFGSMQDSVVKNAINTVYDTDAVDATFRDAVYVSLSEATNQEQQCAVSFGAVRTNAMNNGSVVGLGDNKQLGWRSARKGNYGNGKQVGRNLSSHTVHFTMDNDGVDSVFQAEGQLSDTSGVVKNIQIRQSGRREDEDEVARMNG